MLVKKSQQKKNDERYLIKAQWIVKQSRTKFIGEIF